MTGYAKAAPAGTRMPYREATATLRCVDDVRSSHYNQLADEANAEEGLVLGRGHAAEGRPLPPRRAGWATTTRRSFPGGGSCIFLHLRSGPGATTSGCTAFEPEPMERLLRWLDPAARPVLVQLPDAEYRARAAEWGLPEPGRPAPQGSAAER